MSFYSYKNANPNCCPGTISGSALDGLQEKVCVQVKRVYDSAMTQEQLTKQTVTITSYAQVNNTCTCNACGCQETQETIPPTSAPVPPITFESCRSTTTEGNIRNLTVDRLCDRPCFARVLRNDRPSRLTSCSWIAAAWSTSARRPSASTAMCC